MKFMTMLTIGCLLSCPSLVRAESAISVTVDGRTYQCSSEIPSQQVTTVCSCENVNSGVIFQLFLSGIDLQTGRQLWNRPLGVQLGFAECQETLTNNPSCR